MKIFRVSCHSDCGSYFCAYLQSLTIIAESVEQAKEFAKKWQRQNQSFIYSEDKWEVREIFSADSGIIDYNIDSDY